MAHPGATAVQSPAPLANTASKRTGTAPAPTQSTRMHVQYVYIYICKLYRYWLHIYIYRYAHIHKHILHIYIYTQHIYIYIYICVYIRRDRESTRCCKIIRTEAGTFRRGRTAATLHSGRPVLQQPVTGRPGKDAISSLCIRPVLQRKSLL